MLALRILIVEEEPVKQSDWRRKSKGAVFSNPSGESVSGR